MPTCGIGIAALHKLELAAAVDDEILSPTAEVHKVRGSRKEGLQDKVPIADGVHGVWADPSDEAKILGQCLPVHSEWVPCQSTCTPATHMSHRLVEYQQF